jgi:hypothetical protein
MSLTGLLSKTFLCVASSVMAAAPLRAQAPREKRQLINPLLTPSALRFVVEVFGQTEICGLDGTGTRRKWKAIPDCCARFLPVGESRRSSKHFFMSPCGFNSSVFQRESPG